MIALVCEKTKFNGKAKEDGTKDLYFTLTLAGLNSYVNDYRIFTTKDSKSGLYVPRKYFVSKELFDSVCFGKIYDFEFGCDNETGASHIVAAKQSK